MFYQWLKHPKVEANPAANIFSTMRAGALTEEILNAKVEGYLAQGFELATDDEVIAERGSLEIVSAEEEAAQAEQEVANGNTSVEAVEENFEAANPEAPVEEEVAAEEAVEAPAEEVAPEAEAPVEEAPVDAPEEVV